MNSQQCISDFRDFGRTGLQLSTSNTELLKTMQGKIYCPH